MKNWEEFQVALPMLHKIEEAYNKLLQFLNKYSPTDTHLHGLSLEDIKDARKAVLEAMAREANKLPGKVYYWLYPFYTGNFLKLVAALGACQAMATQKDDEESRRAFYRFFRTVPVEERLKLGDRLDQPELTDQAMQIQKKIKTRKAQIKLQLDKFHSN